MKAVVYRDKEKFELTDRPVPVIREPGDSVVKVMLSSICSSDWHIIHGLVPRAVKNIILGHEFVGEVLETGNGVKKFKAGDRVAVNCETFCGECFYCRQGYVNNCEKGGWELGCRIDGCQAEYVRVPLSDTGMTKIPDDVSYEAALFVGDILSTGYWSAAESEIEPGMTVAVIGSGPAGMCAMECCRLYHPARIVAVDISEYRLEVAKRNGLCDITVNSAKEDPVKVLRSLTEGRGADRVIEAAGGKNTFEMAWKTARPNAVIMIAAMYPEAQILPLPDMYGKNLIFKTGGVDASSCAEILNLIHEKKLDTGFLITHRAPLNDILKGYDIFGGQKDGCIKWAVTPYER